jgi:hypothetical protein
MSDQADLGINGQQQHMSLLSSDHTSASHGSNLPLAPQDLDPPQVDENGQAHPQIHNQAEDQDGHPSQTSQSPAPLQSLTPGQGNVETEWMHSAPLTPESLPDVGFDNITAADGGSVPASDIIDTPESPQSRNESEPAIKLESRDATQSQDFDDYYSQGSPGMEMEANDYVSDSVSHEVRKIYGFIPDEPLVVDPRLARYETSSSTPPTLHTIDSDSWIPEDFYRQPTGSTVAEPESVLGSSGRTYHGFKEGKYFMPNDGVSHYDLGISRRIANVPAARTRSFGLSA